MSPKPADYVLSKYLLDELDENKRKLVEDWLSASSANRIELEKYRETIFRHEATAGAFETRVRKLPLLYGIKNRIHQGYPRLSYAFLCVLVLFIGITSYLIHKKHPKERFNTFYTEKTLSTENSKTFYDTLHTIYQMVRTMCIVEDSQVISINRIGACYLDTAGSFLSRPDKTRTFF